MMRHLVSAQYWDQPAGGDTGHLFLAFGRLVCTDGISNCPLDRVLTYKNLIYLLNLQIYLLIRSGVTVLINGSVFSTVGLSGNDPSSQIPFGWFLSIWISEPVISVDTVFWPQPAWSNLGKGVPRPLLEPYCYHSDRQHHGGCLFKEGGVSRALFVPYYGES